MNKYNNTILAAGLALSACSDARPGMSYVYDQELVDCDSLYECDAIAADVGRDINDVFGGNDISLPSQDGATFVDVRSDSGVDTQDCVRTLPADFERAVDGAEGRMLRGFPNTAAAQSRIFSVDTGLYDTRLTDVFRFGDNQNEGLLAVTVLGSTDTHSRVSICTIEFNRTTQSYFDPNCFTYTIEGDDLTSQTQPIPAWQITESARQNDPRRRTYQMSFNYEGGDVAGCDIKFDQPSQPESGYRINDVCDFVCTGVSEALIGRHQEFLRNHPQYRPGM